MKRSVATAFLLSVLGAPVLEAYTCSCTAPDASCGTVVICQGGCYAYCLSNNNCWSGCSVEDPPERCDMSYSAPFSFAFQESPAPEVSRVISEHLGTRLVYIPTRSSERFSFNFENSSFAELLDVLGRDGIVGAAHDFNQASAVDALLNTRVDIRAEHSTVSAFSIFLAEISRGEVFLRAPILPRRAISLDVKEIQLGELEETLSVVAPPAKPEEGLDRPGRQ